ncbi:hypothetical protein BDV26DRAFT_266391 [Aspergillus bertholletiae]|uniref:Rhodopsin domain-containing protein n=1 Tax=Aspergillus bertholletiae TaxID=1226010 RepID=A0A5N7B1V5_9EURO|nr:hypothetical protein BDV26DRAFT_266391 [Aspergillus bertholletiae]
MPLLSHYGDIADSSDALVYPSLIFSILTPIVVASRLLGRHVLSGRIGADDWTILVSCVFAEIVSIQMIVVCTWAFGKHQDDVPKELVLRTLKLYFVAQILYKINLGLTKISILLLYMRLFIQRWFRITCCTWIAIILAFTLGTVFSSIFQCSPVQYAFNKTIPGGGTCINMTAFWYANAAFNILTDLVIVGLPIPIVTKLHLPTKSKIALCGMFAMGIFVCITSILRITTLDIATSYLDITWNSIGSSMWTVIESNLGIICACLPALHRPLVFAFPRLFSRFQRSWVYESQSQLRDSRAKRVGPDSATKKIVGWSVLDESVAVPEEGGETPLVQSRVALSQTRSETQGTTQAVMHVGAIEGKEIELGEIESYGR